MRQASKGLEREVQVGLFVLLGVLVIGAFALRITQTPIFRSGTQLVVYLKDAAGLYKNSKVRIAGINVGVVRKIELEGTQARITVMVDHGHKIPKSAIAVPRAIGILGDKYLSIEVPESTALETEPLIKEEGASLHILPRKSSRLMNRLIPQLLGWAAAEPMILKEGDVIPSNGSGASVDEMVAKFGGVGDNLNAITKDLKDLIAENRKELDASFKSIHQITSKLADVLKEIDPKSLGRSIHSSTENLNKITSRIEQGEGTLGKLVNDEETVEHINRTLLSINEVVERARRTSITVDINPNYLFNAEESKSYLGIQLMPRKHYGYAFYLLQDPMGRVEEKIKETTTGGTKTTVEEKIIHKSKFKYSFQLIRRIQNAQFRLGLFENTGGVALDLDLFPERLTLSTELFDIARENENPRIRTYATFRFYRYFYLRAGSDDLIKKEKASDALFAGLGLSFTDHDIKSVLVLPGVF